LRSYDFRRTCQTTCELRSASPLKKNGKKIVRINRTTKIGILVVEKTVSYIQLLEEVGYI